MSPKVTTLSPLVLIASAAMSSGRCTTPGTFTEYMPLPDCRSPAGTSWLLLRISAASSPGVTP